MMIDIKELQNYDLREYQRSKENKQKKKSFYKTIDILCKITEDCLKNKAGLS